MGVSTLASTDVALAGFAAEVGTEGPVAVRGGGTRWNLGGVLTENARLVEVPSGIVDYQPAEMIVTVRAGTNTADLHASLAEHGQTCALPERGGTVGGAVAVGENRLDRLGRGSVRDAVLQVRYVSSEGDVVTGGGPVVKNVTGFNIPKLLTGSLGTLGLIAEVVLRTNPLPPVQRWLRAESVDPRDLRDVVLRPGAVLWDGTSSWILVEGHEADVDSEIEARCDPRRHHLHRRASRAAAAPVAVEPIGCFTSRPIHRRQLRREYRGRHGLGRQLPSLSANQTRSQHRSSLG